MDPETLALIASLTASAAGGAGKAYLGSKAANSAEEQAEKDRKEDARRWNIQNGMEQENQPYGQADMLAKLRATLAQPTQYDFLSALNTRYGAPAAA